MIVEHKVETSETGAVSETALAYLAMHRDHHKHGQKIKEYYAKVELQIAIEDYVALTSDNFGVSRENYMFTKATIANWNLAFIATYLANVDAVFKRSETRKISYSKNTNKNISKIQNDTLYVPDYILHRYATLTGDNSEVIPAEELFVNYPYPYKVIPVAELNEKILTSEEPILYMIYVRGRSRGYANIFESKSYELLYNDASALALNFKVKNVDRITKTAIKLTK